MTVGVDALESLVKCPRCRNGKRRKKERCNVCKGLGYGMSVGPTLYAPVDGPDFGGFRPLPSWEPEPEP